MTSAHHGSGSNKPLIIGIGLVVVVYLLLAGMGLPQKWTDQALGHGAHEAAEDHDATVEEHGPDAEHTDVDAEHAHDEDAAAAAAHPEGDEGSHDAGHDAPAEHGEHAAHDAHGPGPAPALWMVTPFALLLLAIAVLPLIPATEHWWESNKNRFLVAAVLGLCTLAYYLVLHEAPIEGHWPGHKIVPHSDSGLNLGLAWSILENAILNEYIPFIVLLFSLYTISGGIRIEGDLKAHPLTNSIIILIGGALASFIGTTGAAMLLIRPLLETNKERKHVVHTVVFFIFVVCNCGGCLLPIGDPPLFLGYLRGVPFLWTMHLWPEWLFVNMMLLGTYYCWDHFFAYPREEVVDIVHDEVETTPLRITGLMPNLPLLIGVVLAVALLAPTMTFPGTEWYPWFYLREIVQVSLVGLSLLLGSKAIREQNEFNYHAILEVAALFFGIFICMQAPLQILQEQGSQLGLTEPMHFFWATGGLSSVLDNAPTYVVFFTTAQQIDPDAGEAVIAGVPETLLVAISLGAVFMGAMTYIGNGPNFMVRAIAEQSGVRMPSFFGYMIYSCLVLLPILVITQLIFCS